MSEDADSLIDNEVTPMLLIKTDNFVKPNNPIFHKANLELNQHQSTTRKSLTVLHRNKMGKATLNQQFQQFLMEDETNSELNVVSMMGTRKIGKSFLIDCLISSSSGRVVRSMSKGGNNPINTYSTLIKGKNDEKILYLDCDGHCKEEEFLWCYFLSSVIVYSMNFGDRVSENTLLKSLSFVKAQLQIEAQDDLSFPQLIIAYRDSVSNDKNQHDTFIDRVMEFNLFDNDPLLVYLPYPGNNAIKAKQLTDIPERSLNTAFLKQIHTMENTIKTCRSKAFKGNYMTCKILSLTVEPLTKRVSKDRRVSATKIWEEVIETLSVGFYNYYIIQYSEKLQKEFEDQRPVDKYTLYKKLSSVKRSIDKKVDGFSNISGDPIFQKYKEKLKETINTKQKMIKEINRVKSRNINNQTCQQLMSKLNQKNYQQLIDQYCRSNLDDQRTEVLMQNFQKVIDAKMKEMEKSREPAKKPSIQITSLQDEIRTLQKQIENQRNSKDKPKPFDFDTARKSLKDKQVQFNELQKELQEQLRHNGGSQIRIVSSEVEQLQRKIDELKVQLNLQEQEIRNLRQHQQSKKLELTKQLQNQLKIEEEKLRKLQELLNRSQIKPQQAKKGAKDNTCCCVIM